MEQRISSVQSEVLRLTIEEGQFDYDISGIDVEEHLPEDRLNTRDSAWEQVSHPNRQYIAKHMERNTALCRLRR